MACEAVQKARCTNTCIIHYSHIHYVVVTTCYLVAWNSVVISAYLPARRDPSNGIFPRSHYSADFNVQLMERYCCIACFGSWIVYTSNIHGEKKEHSCYNFPLNNFFQSNNLSHNEVNKS